jgi:hypothetical protein
MGLRETLNENPRVTTGITVGIIVVVLALILWPRGNGAVGGGGGRGAPSQLFYTVDDGKTWFPDDAKKIPPFKKDDKEAVRAAVYKCGGKTFVNHMERYTPEGQKKLAAIYAKGDAADGLAASDPATEGAMEVKSPGDKDWVKITDPKAQAVMKPKCADGGDLEVLRP